MISGKRKFSRKSGIQGKAKRVKYGQDPVSPLKRSLYGIFERKFVDTIATATSVSTDAPVVTLVNGVAQGSDFTNRIGRKTNWTSLQFKCHFASNAPDQAPQRLKVMVIYDKQPTNALPALTDILTASTSLAYNNLNNRDRFITLIDNECVMGETDNPATQTFSHVANTKNIDKYQKVNLTTIFDGTGATLADINTGAIYVVTVGSTTTATAWTAVWSVRLRFVDA